MGTTYARLRQAEKGKKKRSRIKTKKIDLGNLPKIEKPTERIEKTSPLSSKQQKKETVRDTTTPRNHDTVIPRNHATTQPRYRDTTTPPDNLTNEIHPDVAETVRKAVKELGKEAATHRFTSSEKKALADLIYTFKQSGFKTSENEITRIAINFLVEDYRQNGELGVLVKVLRKLNA